MEGNRRFSVKTKSYLFVTITVFLVAVGTSLIAFSLSSDELDRYYKQGARDNARNIATYLNGERADYIERLIPVIKTEEFQWLRRRAEDEGDGSLIEDYLKEEEVWDEYSEISSVLTNFNDNMDDINCMNVIANGGRDMEYDMYIIVDDHHPLFNVGFYEIRENELKGKDLANLEEPIISDGTWGWFCSDFEPVYDSDGNIVCVVECQYGTEDVMAARRSMLISLFIGSVIFTVTVLGVAVWFINATLITPIRAITKEMKKFKPSDKDGYDSAGVIKLDMRYDDEVSDIYYGIRQMQMDILDYLKAKTKAENDIRNKDNRIGQLSNETNRDPLTGVGSKSAYLKKLSELNRKMSSNEPYKFAFIVVDMNNLKYINDTHGHKAGDLYITGSCNMIGDVFTNSPVYRIGGDEFVAILTDEDYNDRHALVEKLKSDYEEAHGGEDKDPWERYSASVGMSERKAEDTTVEDVFKRADKAMYEDKEIFRKNNGRYR